MWHVTLYETIYGSESLGPTVSVVVERRRGLTQNTWKGVHLKRCEGVYTYRVWVWIYEKTEWFNTDGPLLYSV